MSHPAVYGPPGREHAVQRRKNRRATYLAQGICPECCVRDVVPNRVRCRECARANSIATAKRQKEKR